MQAPAAPIPVFFLAGGTGISAETLGNMILQQFPEVAFTRHKYPFITTVEQALKVVEVMDAACTDEVQALAFSTVAPNDVRDALGTTRAAMIDMFGSHLDTVERMLHVQAARASGSAHGVGDIGRYDARMKAVEFAIEHDDGQSLRHLAKADLILTAPSRCGKTPTTMYLALTHGLLVANYPLVDEDFESTSLPRPIAPYRDKLFGLLSTPTRLSQVRSERRPGSKYASLAQCSWELRSAEALFRQQHIPYVDSSSMSVEEIAAVIQQQRAGTVRPG